MNNKDLSTKALDETKLFNKKQKEGIENNLLSELYCFFNECMGANDCSAEMEAEMKLDEALESGKTANEIMNLATDWYSEGREAGFKMGFHIATKLLTEGLR
ncbi:MAG: hypothetical protein HDT30_10605 [Clostridiales bacterium]|nr:hypothetical protein [Clostridiales bacterium]